jgi:hypothetical protein
MQNPYETPLTTPGDKSPTAQADVRQVVSGQKLLINSILGYIGSLPILAASNAFLGGTPEQPMVTPMFGFVLAVGLLGLLAAAVFACLGIFRMGAVLYPGSTRYIYAIGVLLPAPLIGLLVMFVANANAIGYLKARGIKVGFFGAKLATIEGPNPTGMR